MSDTRVLGRRIKAARTAAGVSLPDLATAIGATVEQQQRVESGEVEPPYTLVLRAAVVLKVTPSTWLCDLSAANDLEASLYDHADAHYELIQGLRPVNSRRSH